MEKNFVQPRYLVRINNRDEEEALFKLATRTDGLAIPLRPGDAEPSFDNLRYWGVEPISFAEARRNLPRGEKRQPEECLGLERHYVVSLGDYQLEAKLFANRKGRIYKHCGSWNSLISFIGSSSPASITVVSDYQRLTYPLFSHLFQHPQLCGGQMEIGFLTGATRSWVRWSLFKALMLETLEQQNEKDLFLFGWKDVGEPNLLHGVQTLWWDDLSPERIQELLADHFYLAALLSHSNGVDGNFSQAILCPMVPDGYTDQISTLDRLSLHEGLPSCAWSTLCQRDHHNTRYRFRPQALSTRISFYDTCAGYLAAGAFCTPTASLGLSFLCGTTAAHVTTIRKKSSNAYLALLFRSFLYDGHTLGWITNQLNRYQHSEFGELPSFVLFGDPLFCMHSKEMNGQGDVVKSEDCITVNDWSSLVMRLGPVVDEEILTPTRKNKDIFCTDLSMRSDPQRDWWIMRPSASGRPVVLKLCDRHSLLENSEKIACAFREGAAFLEILHQGVQSNPAYEPDLRLLAAVIAEARELLPAFDHIRQKASSRSWHYSAKATLQEDIEQVLASINTLNAFVPLAWRAANQWSVLRHYYTNSLDMVGYEQGARLKCRYCGSWMSTKQSANPEHEWILRTSYVCVRCGVVADVPVFASLPAIEGPQECSPGETIQQKFRVVLDIPQGVSVETLLYFGGFGSEVIRCTIQPETAKAELGHRGCAESGFTLHFDSDCPCGIYSLVAVASAMVTPLVAAKYLNVVPPEMKLSGAVA